MVLTVSKPPKRLLSVQPPCKRPLWVCFHSLRCLSFIFASFFVNSIRMFISLYALTMERTSGVLKITIATESS